MESTYAEFVEGLLSESELRTRLGHLVQPTKVVVGFDAPTTTSGSTSLNGQSVLNSSTSHPLALAVACSL
jgi:hypothetical protein